MASSVSSVLSGASQTVEVPGDVAVELVSVLRLQAGGVLQQQNGESILLQYAVPTIGAHLEVRDAE